MFSNTVSSNNNAYSTCITTCIFNFTQTLFCGHIRVMWLPWYPKHRLFIMHNSRQEIKLKVSKCNRTTSQRKLNCLKPEINWQTDHHWRLPYFNVSRFKQRETQLTWSDDLNDLCDCDQARSRITLHYSAQCCGNKPSP